MRWLFTKSLVLFGGVYALTAVPARSLIFGKDCRQSYSTDAGTLYAPIGIAYGRVPEAYATAFLIDDCHAITAQHVFGAQQTTKGTRAVFIANVTGPPARWRTSWASVAAYGHYNEAGGVLLNRSSDWVVLRLKTCLGKYYGHVNLSWQIPSPRETIAIAGYPIDRPLTAGVSIDPMCHIRAVRAQTLLNDCAALPGSSGGPLFRITQQSGSRSLEVFAITEGAHSAVDLGMDHISYVDSFPDNVWNLAIPLPPLSDLNL